ncbi:carboxymuconolactone decarboxylase family protein [Streptomyces niveus]|uniref:hypothetical protein n=1 Tax=Streptomyces niveus TaxID=193462 RepID=UPI00364AFE93
MASWQDSPYFDAAGRVPDELYDLVAAQYDDKALATLMNAIGQVGFFIAIALVAKPVPGRSFSDPWR